MAMRAFHINKDGVKTEVTGVITELTIAESTEAAAGAAHSA